MLQVLRENNAESGMLPHQPFNLVWKQNQTPYQMNKNLKVSHVLENFDFYMYASTLPFSYLNQIYVR
jgi:hypothetical protein